MRKRIRDIFGWLNLSRKLKVKLVSRTCINSFPNPIRPWPASFLARKGEEYCECPECEVQVTNGVDVFTIKESELNRYLIVKTL